MSMHVSVPLFYHPTRLFLVDDDAAWLNSMSLSLDGIFDCVIEDDATKAYAALKKRVYDIKKLSAKVNNPDSDTLSIDFSQFGNIITARDYREKVVTIVIDYNMPRLDGLSFCRQAAEEHLPVKFILLTGAAGLSQAVAAFNDGIIHAYIDKGDAHMVEKVVESARGLSIRQFVELSAAFSSVFSNLGLLSDSDFVKVFYNFFQKHKVTAFHVINASGTFLLCTQSNERKMLVVKSDEDFDMACDMAEHEEAPRAVQQALVSRKAYPVNATDTAHLELKIDHWEKWMTPFNKISGKDIFYALVDA